MNYWKFLPFLLAIIKNIELKIKNYCFNLNLRVDQ